MKVLVTGGTNGMGKGAMAQAFSRSADVSSTAGA